MDDLRTVLKLTHTLWGGRFNPIIPFDDDEVADPLVKIFRIDALYPAFRDDAFKQFAARHPFLHWPEFGDGELFVSGMHGKTAGFLDIYHPVRSIYEKFVENKSQPKVHPQIFKWDATDPLNDVLLAMVGDYPAKTFVGRDYADFLQKNLKATITNVDLAQPLQSDLYRIITPNVISAWDMEGDRATRFNSPGIYAGNADDFDDIVNFWNLRAADADLLFYDARYDTRLRPHIEEFLTALRKRPKNPQGWPVEIGLWSKSRTMEERPNFGNDVGHHVVDAVTWNGLNLRPPMMYVKGDHSALASVSENYDIPSLAFELSKKPFYDDIELHNQHLIASVRIFGGFVENSNATFHYPYLPELNEYYGREAHGLYNAIRSEPEGLGVIVDVRTNDVRLAALPKNDLIANIFKAFGIHCEQSQPGRIASRLIHQMGGIQGCRVFKIAGVRNLIESYDPLHAFTRSAAMQKIGEVDPRTGRPNFERYETLFLEHRSKPKLKPDDALLYLLKKGVFRAGLNLECPNCNLDFWLPLDAMATEVACEYCGKKFDITSQLRDRDWAYRRSGLFGRADHQEGSVPVVVTLQQLNTVTHWDSLFTTNMKLLPESAAIDACETDLVFLSWHFGGKLELAIGECKAAGQEITDGDIANLTKVADAFPNERMHLYIVFAKTGTFTDAEIARCKKAADDYAAVHGDFRIILLSQRELEPYFVYEWAEKEFNIHRTAISLGDLARGTHDIYFDPKPKNTGGTS